MIAVPLVPLHVTLKYYQWTSIMEHNRANTLAYHDEASIVYTANSHSQDNKTYLEKVNTEK